ncbi:major facilitator family transporter [Centipeda periodontii DSM 2778]|uniref:Major facilitator family transporter n=1 Tax=Centipeda periodontii DSM 2778 TaxID=888060 RepID=F5RJK9_9FIRM|nr:major facilitator family transporter [Centipeda periodontii DSM 2778]
MRIPMRQYMALLGITIAAFIFNTSEFIPIALLIDISESFSMTEAATGQMITIYAWVVALLSLPLMLLTCRMELKRLLLMMVALFGLGQLAIVPRDASTVATAIYSGIFNLAHIGYIGAAIAAVAALLCRYVYVKDVQGR